MTTERMKALAAEAMRNAQGNGHDLWREDPSRVASDMKMYDADLEDADHGKLARVIAELQAERGS